MFSKRNSPKRIENPKPEADLQVQRKELSFDVVFVMNMEHMKSFEQDWSSQTQYSIGLITRDLFAQEKAKAKKGEDVEDPQPCAFWSNTIQGIVICWNETTVYRFLLVSSTNFG
eukprot:TRINITY_DN2006_c0_g1_i1.p3 TRINITY_DN2006_c0_g1~~TRINITY_DN2006_c0_g1_i1.p3  ORF type:complete len:114 (-),score=22.95 TRINITY_DN2006_c0_g1_i1:1686-2027(-)